MAKRRARRDERASAVKRGRSEAAVSAGLRRAARRAFVGFALGLLLVVVALVLVLTPSAPRRSGTNGVWADFPLDTVGEGARFCQTRELLPSGTAAIRFVLLVNQAPGPSLRIVLSRHGSILERTSATVGSGHGSYVSAPLRPARHAFDDVEVCVTVGTGGSVILVGGPTFGKVGSLIVDGRNTGGSLRIDYFRPGRESWWAVAATVAKRMALGRGRWGGPWMVWLLVVAVLSAIALTIVTVIRTVATDQAPWLSCEAAAEGAVETGPVGGLRGILRSVPTVAWAVAAVAVLNAVAWSIITPAFQVPDEDTHVAYVQLIGETGHPPANRRTVHYSPELAAAVADSRGAAVWSSPQQRGLERDLDGSLARRGNDSAGPSSPEPPLYYAIEAIPYRLASGATLLDRVALMRLLSALMAGVTALFALLFVRECLPGRPWAWTVGGLGVAWVPMLGFVSGGVNPDALLFAVSGALFYCLARAFRRGMTTRIAVWAGVVLAVGAVAKINFYGLVPGALAALALAARATDGAWNRRALRLVGISVAIGIAPYVLITMLDALVWERPFILARTPAEAPEDHGNLWGQLSYLWQVYLPRLPGQATAIPGFYPGWELWFKRFVGVFGWLVVKFPAWAYRLAAAVVGALFMLVLRALWRERDEIHRRRAELLGYGMTAGTLLLLIGLVALRGWAPGIGGAIQGRYLLPLLPLWGALLALATRGAGSRWDRTVGTVSVAVVIAWSLFGQLTTIAYFYG